MKNQDMINGQDVGPKIRRENMVILGPGRPNQITVQGLVARSDDGSGTGTWFDGTMILHDVSFPIVINVID